MTNTLYDGLRVNWNPVAQQYGAPNWTIGPPGPPGPPGKDSTVPGPPGPAGAPGVNGVRGSIWWHGHGPPTGGNPVGPLPQDMYLDDDTGNVYVFS